MGLREQLVNAALEAGDLDYARALRTMPFDQKAFLTRLAYYTC